MKRQFFVCNCQDVEHQFILSFDDEERDHYCDWMYLDVHLAKDPFWTRVKYGIKYIFGYQCRYGAFAEIIINRPLAQRLKQFIEDYLNDNNTTTTTSN